MWRQSQKRKCSFQLQTPSLLNTLNIKKKITSPKDSSNRKTDVCSFENAERLQAKHLTKQQQKKKF